MLLPDDFVRDIKTLWVTAQQKAITLVNRTMIEAYWEIGRRILDEEQKGEDRARYGQFLLRELAEALSKEFDKALDERELRKIRQFYQYFPIRDALRPELTWTHYRALLRVPGADARRFYLLEAATQGWSTRQLERNIQSFYFERIVSSQTPIPSTSPLPQRAPMPPPQPADLIKDPFILEFLGLDMPAGFSESELETAILSNIHDVLLELGKGFAFVGRQVPIKTDTKIFYIDLVFYNYLLKCFTLVELKTTELSHQDIGQLDMYVRMFDDLRKVPGDNPTIGIILTAEKDATIVKYSVLEESQQLFASRYRLVLPTEEELAAELNRDQLFLPDRDAR